MKKLRKIILLAGVLFGFASYSQNLKKLDEKNGFRDMKLGMSIDSVKNLKEIENSGDSKYYEKLDENLKVGDYQIQSICYGFYKGYLSFILIKTKGYTNSRGIKDVIVNLYGNGWQSNRYMEKYNWFGENVSLSYDENSITNDAQIVFQSKPLSKQRELDKKEKDEKAANGM